PGSDIPAYRLEVGHGDRSFPLDDPHPVWPPHRGNHERLGREAAHPPPWEELGAHERTLDGVAGTSFAVWAPNARAVRVVGEFNGWDGRLHPMRLLGASGVWELFVPGVAGGA